MDKNEGNRVNGWFDFHKLPRCNAPRRKCGLPCQRAARYSTGRCRLHSGRPPSSRRFTKLAELERRKLSSEIKAMRRFNESIREEIDG